MSIISYTFPIFVLFVVAFYYIAPLRFRWVTLLISSYVFLWLSSEWLLTFHFLATLITFLCGLGIEKFREDKKKAKRIRNIGILLVLGILLFLKYWNFFSSASNRLLSAAGFSFPKIPVLLPIGISFYTLQAIAYMTDVYRKKISADRSLPRFMLFMSFFPQIIQGPIPRHAQLAGQLYEPHRFDYNRVMHGIQLMLWGIMKKIVIADRIAIPVNAIFAKNTPYTGMMILFGGVLYGVQVYADFSGGMDIVRGISQILGIELELNFRQPYFSRSIEEFWRRWHITLGSFMRDYVFYPLSLSKAFKTLGKKTRQWFGASFGKKLPSLLAMFIVYFLVGFWHGASWKYIAYGLWNGFFIMSGILFADVFAFIRMKLGIVQESFTWRVFQMFRTFLICSVGRLFPRASGLKNALSMMHAMTVRPRDLSPFLDGTLVQLGLNTANWVLLCVMLCILFYVGLLHERGVPIREKIASQHIIFRWMIYLGAIAAILIFGTYGPGYSSAAFIYEQF